MAVLLPVRDGADWDPSLPAPPALLTVPQDVISGQEGFSRDGFPDLRPRLQAHVDPLAGSAAIKFFIVKHLEETGRGWGQRAHP